MNLSARSLWKIDLAGVAGLAIIIALVAVFQVHPMLRDRESHAELTGQLSQEHQKLEDRRKAVHHVRTQADRVQTFLAAHHLELEATDELNSRLTRLTDLATAQGLQLDVIQPGKPTTGPQYDTLPILLQGRGGYADLTRFLAAVRRQLPDTTVTSIDLAGGAEAQRGPGRFSFGLLWFSAPSGKSAAQP